MVLTVVLLVTNHGKMGTLDRKTGWYLPEVAHPYKVFKEAKFEIILASPHGGSTPMDPLSFVAFEGDNDCMLFRNEFGIHSEDAALESTVALNTVDLASVNGIFCAGGHGPMFDLPDNEVVNNSVASVYENGGWVAAVCHGAAGIVNTKLSNGEYLVKGKKVTCFTNSEEDEMELSQYMPFMLETKLIDHGAIFEKASNWQSKVVVCDRVVTGQNPASATPITQAIVNLLSQQS